MRDAYYSKHFLTREDTGEVVGISLGYDHCAEHEWGVKGLKNLLHFQDKKYPMGVADRIVQPPLEVVERAVSFTEFKVRLPADPKSGKKTMTVKAARFCVSKDVEIAKEIVRGYSDSYTESIKKAILGVPTAPYDLRYPSTRKPFDYSLLDSLESKEKGKHIGENDVLICSKWGENSFLVEVWGELRVEALKKIFESFVEGKSTLSLSGSNNPFEGRGLCIVQVEKLTEEEKTSILTQDLEYKNLQEEFEASGLREILEKANKSYYALSPRRREDGTIAVWLNPREQSKFKSGWYSIEDLKLWAVNQGPVMESKVSA